MTDKKPFADRARDQTTAGNSPHAHRVSGRRRRIDVAMKHLWPVLVVPPIPMPDPAPGPYARRRK
jgi:hypothetical protein